MLGYVGDIIADVFDLNNTMGWKFSVINSTIDWISGLILLLFLVIYGLINLLKISTQLVYSKIHFITICISTMLFSFTDIDFIIIYLSLGISLNFF